MGIKSHNYVVIQHEHFSSINQLAQFTQNISDARKNTTDYEAGAVKGQRILTQGDTSLVEQARKLINRFQEEIPTLRRVWQPSIAGFFPNVPAFLMGEPESMWHMGPEESDKAPIRVWVGVGSSASVSEQDLIKRGAVLAAFAMALSERRPVLITPYWQIGDSRSGTKGLLISWDLQTSPLVLSEVMGCLANPRVIRDLGLHTLQRFDPSFPSSCPFAPNAFSEKYMREYLDCEDGDIWLPGILGSDDLLADPIGWIKREIARHLGEGEDD